MKRSLSLFLACSASSFVATGHAGAQGANDCSVATPIAGNGTFAVTTVGATDSPQQSNSCAVAHNDVWFRWTAAHTGAALFQTCGGTTADSVIAVYAGSACPASGTQMACVDDTCGLQSSITFPVTAGNDYMLQLGSWNPAETWTGTFTLGPGSGGCPTPSVGPDIIIGDLTGVMNAPAGGGLDAFAVGVGACNVGDTVVNWWANTNLHPVVGYSLYRYKLIDGAARFEQVGLSWLKHGFGAATESLCCACQNPNNFQLLGVGCSDTYSADLNGTQAPLGPRWQVNAATGVFAYPPANPGWSGTTARRCEVALSDLEATGGTTRYFCEGQYVTQDDLIAGNHDNNESYREIAVSGALTNFDFTLIGSTARMMSAIEAWPTLQTGVTLTDVHVPGDGRFFVGSRTTSLGGGLHHYEYAVHNMNSDRNGGTFSVPIPAGVLVTNIGFHDVTHRNGDGPGNVSIDGTDWTATLAGGSLTWSTQTEAQNVRANAIRWGTTYNFRFDADAGPASGNVDLGLWKSGAPASVAAAADVPAGASGLSLCHGDGSGTPCPCGNNSPPSIDAGCLNSLGAGGALDAIGSPSISADTLVLQGTSMPDSSALYFQGTARIAGGAGAAFGDGLRCAGGTAVRLGTKTNAGGASSYPAGGDLSISVRGNDAAGDVRTYQVWYRNAAAFCTTDTFNLTNAWEVIWQI